MALYYCRHGKTDWNERFLVQGRVDIPLNEEGLLQAEKTREILKDTPIDFAICSPLERTKKTAEIILEGRDVPLYEDPRIIEIFYGEYEGTNRKHEPFCSRKKEHFRRFKGGESFFDAAYRVYSFLHELEEKYPDKNILVVAHGGLSRIIHSYFYDMSNEEFEGHVIDNCAVYRYEWPHRQFPIVIENPID